MLFKLNDLRAGNYSHEVYLSRKELEKLELMVIEELKKKLPENAWTMTVNLNVAVQIQGSAEQITTLRCSSLERFEFKTDVKVTEEMLKDKQTEVLSKLGELADKAASEKTQKILDTAKGELNEGKPKS